MKLTATDLGGFSYWDVEGDLLVFQWEDRRELVQGKPQIRRGKGYFQRFGYGQPDPFLADLDEVTVTPDGLKCIGTLGHEMALRLSKAFRTTPEFWLNLQQQYDLWHTRQRVGELQVRELGEPYSA